MGSRTDLPSLHREYSDARKYVYINDLSVTKPLLGAGEEDKDSLYQAPVGGPDFIDEGSYESVEPPVMPFDEYGSPPKGSENKVNKHVVFQQATGRGSSNEASYDSQVLKLPLAKSSNFYQDAPIDGISLSYSNSAVFDKTVADKFKLDKMGAMRRSNSKNQVLLNLKNGGLSRNFGGSVMR